MFAGVKEIDCLLVGPEFPEKRPVVGRGVGDSNQLQVGPHFPDMGDLGGEQRFQRRLSGFRPKTQRFQASAVRVMETDRPAGRPARFPVPVGAKRNPVKRDGAPLRQFPPRGPWPPPSPSSACLPSSTDAQLDDGVMPPNLSKISAPSFGVQWHRSVRALCAPVRQAQAFVDRRERRASRRAVQRTGERDLQRGFSTSLRWTGRKPDRPGGPDRRSRPSAHLPGTARPRSRLCNPTAANASPRPGPSSRRAAKDRNASAAPSGNPERDKRSCETDMRMMLGVDANILPRVWSILFCPPWFAGQTRNGVLSRNRSPLKRPVRT